MLEALAAASVLLAQEPARPPVQQPPPEYRSLEPITVQVTFADAEWVNRACRVLVGRDPPEGMVYEACAGIGQKWMILRHGALYPGQFGEVIAHETGHVRGWAHGPTLAPSPTP